MGDQFPHHRSSRVCAKTGRLKKIAWHHGLIIGVLSLFWLIVRTGRKPSRIHYPCQQTALINVTLFLVPPVAFLCYWVWSILPRMEAKRLLRYCVVAAVVLGLGVSVFMGRRMYTAYRAGQYYRNLQIHGPFGRVAPTALGVAAGTLLTVPHAMGLPSPHRVVSVHDEDATAWTFTCTGSGACPEYYGDDAYVNQSVVDQMVATGLKALTGADSVAAAWQVILPGYQSGETIAVKVNFNDAIMGGGTSGYGDNDAYVDALPQIVNSLVAELVDFGVSPEDIWVYDASRYITDRFRERITFEDIQYVDRYGNGADVQAATFDSTDPGAQVDFSGTSYGGTHRIADVLIEADYLINIPIMKRHGGAGITLALKNHLGSIDGFYTGGHSMHNYFYLSGSNYQSDVNPMVNINDASHIRDKTVLIIGDALYGGWRSNNTPPERWVSFDNDSPNMLFFAGDPVAVDSVMFDYLDHEGYVNPASEDILIVAAEQGLGVHERWNNDTDRQYQSIDYIEIEGADSDIPDSDDPDDPVEPDDPPDDPIDDPDDPSPPDDSGSSGGCMIRCLLKH